MKLEILSAAGRSATAEPDEIAAILAVLEAVDGDGDAAPVPAPKPSRWRMAASSFDTAP